MLIVRLLRLLMWMMLFGVVAVFVAGFLIVEKYSSELPDHETLAKYEPPIMTRVHAGDGQLISEFAEERRMFLPIQAIPDTVKQAYLSAEDKNFYKHAGLDFTGIARAVIGNVKAKISGSGGLSGASTITQQVAKNFLLTSDKTIDRKIKEAILAVKIENAFSKDQILELYLNQIYLGLRSHGVAAAALNYFGKAVYELTPAEAAYLAALPKGPNNYHPFRNTQRAIERRNWVLDRMVDNGYLDKEVAEKEKTRPLNVVPRSFDIRIQASDYFVEEVRRQLADIYGQQEILSNGYSVRTTLDPKMQVMARNALVGQLVKYDKNQGWRGPFTSVDQQKLSEDWANAFEGIKLPHDIAPWQSAVVLSLDEEGAKIGLEPDKLPNGKYNDIRQVEQIPLAEMKWAKWAKGEKKGKAISTPSDVLSIGDIIFVTKMEDGEGYHLHQIPEVSGGIVVMDPQTGRVHALVGGFSYDLSQFNRATQAYRQPGSSFKPFVYAAALDNGYTPSNVILDAPIEYNINGETWRPQNYSKEFYGPSTLRIGIEKSRNVMTVRLAEVIGMPIIAEYADLFGIYDNLSPVLAMSLGAGETTVLRMTTAYSMLANGGKQIRPTLIDRIQNRYGKTIYKHDERFCEDCNAVDWHGQDEPQIVDQRLQILDPHTAYQVTSMLEGVLKRGTAVSVGKTLGRPAAGKTGTTNDYRDAWFMGYTPNLVVGVYIGYDTPRSMGRSATGGGLAAPVFGNFINMALKGDPPTPFPVPSGITLYRINPQTGMRASSSDRQVILEPFKPGTAPPENISNVSQDFFN